MLETKEKVPTLLGLIALGAMSIVGFFLEFVKYVG